jgi:LytS/YehU family sensor histidine kinase
VHVIPLEDELAFLVRYLEIERIRFGDRLSVALEVEPEARRAAVPSFLLQPLVENAIRHGAGQREADGRMWLSARRRNASLEIHVQDNGPGIAEQRRSSGQGIGLSNTRRRLEELYGSDHALSLAERPGGGVDVRVAIPFRVIEAVS